MTVAPGLPRLILVDGLPGSGKSTTAQLAARHIERHGHAADWVYEEETPHPIFDYAVIRESLNCGRLPPRVFDAALDSWRGFAAVMPAWNRSVVLDSSFFQTPLHPMLMVEWDHERIADYVLAVERAIADLRPLLVVLRDADVGARLGEAIDTRVRWFFDLLDSRLATAPYGIARGWRGAGGMRAYLEDVRDLIDRLTARLRIETLVVPVHGGRRDEVNAAIAARLGLPPFEPFETRVSDLEAFVGAYHHPEAGDVYRVETDGTHLYLGPIPKTRLIHREGAAFDVAGVCLQFEFVANGNGRMSAIRCRGGLPGMPCELIRR